MEKLGDGGIHCHEEYREKICRKDLQKRVFVGGKGRGFNRERWWKWNSEWTLLQTAQFHWLVKSLMKVPLLFWNNVFYFSLVISLSLVYNCSHPLIRLFTNINTNGGSYGYCITSVTCPSLTMPQLGISFALPWKTWGDFISVNFFGLWFTIA